MGHISISLDKESLIAGDKKWAALLASNEAQRLLGAMADEASHEILAGKATPMICIEGRDKTFENMTVMKTIDEMLLYEST